MMRFFVNVWRFRKELAQFKSFDHSFCLMMFRRSIEILHKSTVDNSYKDGDAKIIAKMARAIELMKLSENTETFLEMAEKEMGEIGINDVHTNRVYEIADKYEMEAWEELWTIIKGTKSDEFDGTDMRTWW